MHKSTTKLRVLLVVCPKKCTMFSCTSRVLSKKVHIILEKGTHTWNENGFDTLTYKSKVEQGIYYFEIIVLHYNNGALT